MSALFLADKTEVVSPEDLEPLVGSDSETMVYARASVSARNKERVVWYVGAATLIGGVLLSGWASRSGPPFGLETPWIGYSLMIAGVVLGYPMSRHYASEELRLRKEAFSTYARDLGLVLNVCAHGMRVIACEQPIDPPPPAPAPPATPATSVPDRTALRMR